jgi:hypothetical protein
MASAKNVAARRALIQQMVQLGGYFLDNESTFFKARQFLQSGAEGSKRSRNRHPESDDCSWRHLGLI